PHYLPSFPTRRSSDLSVDPSQFASGAQRSAIGNRYLGVPVAILGGITTPLATAMITHQANGVVAQVEAALAACQQFLPNGFACHAVARRIAECYEHDPNGTPGFWIVRPGWTVGGRP